MTDILALLQPIQNDFAAVESNHRSDDCHDRARNDAGADDVFDDVIEYRAVPHLTGNCWRIKQMEPNLSICITGRVGLTDDRMDDLPTRT